MEIPANDLLYLMRGSIGKEIVVKKYGKKMVLTKFPDMRYIIPTVKQVERRKLFADAVAFAKKLMNNKEQVATMKLTIAKGQSIYQATIKFYLNNDKVEKERAMQETERLLSKALSIAENPETPEKVHCIEFYDRIETKFFAMHTTFALFYPFNIVKSNSASMTFEQIISDIKRNSVTARELLFTQLHERMLILCKRYVKTN